MAQHESVFTSYKGSIACFLFIIGLSDVNLVTLSVFDSPAALKDILVTEVVFLKSLKATHAKKNEILCVLEDHFDRIPKQTNRSTLNSFIKTSANKSLNFFYHLRYRYTELKYNHMYLDKLENAKNNGYVRKDFGVNKTFYLHESSGSVFNGALTGILMLQHVYDLNVEHLVNGSLHIQEKPNVLNVLYQKKVQQLKVFDLVMVGSHAIKLGLYDSAVTFFQSTKIEKENGPIISSNSLILEKRISFLLSLAKKGLTLQQQHKTFDLQSRLLPFSTARFDYS